MCYRVRHFFAEEAFRKERGRQPDPRACSFFPPSSSQFSLTSIVRWRFSPESSMTDLKAEDKASGGRPVVLFSFKCKTCDSEVPSFGVWVHDCGQGQAQLQTYMHGGETFWSFQGITSPS
uniref:Uncharacterized protein n=1 Tax=Chromera velia CCMP2878 TaxID=1169474 RepID=A0A0G4FLX6_9ALVE|mmetsp:Transcript_54619/g.106848  ORF Transcript_54619/g.106848 Transcript_54619/m.106848 type:complete len:120 (+) Transcript_54619:1392-1751(+)|eukprot:Cvel_17660.t1-p1 / transcript=Cvel_17660.t1 / gene=Cvel_17660 / organism=Chromera_velia_CCMP2878 / gene_product=hypothetical protein / transcript_product=hypothetical protein / location=Cvel_scaffold1422:31470-33591(+) / protein_length=119 / sequence_SO=supercontig / SO=protein_coding / is_pseudo=false